MNLNEPTAGILGKVKIYRVYPDGTKEFRKEVKNIIVNTGLYRYLDLMGGAQTERVTAFAWGSGGLSSGSVVAKVATTSGLTTQDGYKTTDLSFARTTNQGVYSCTLNTGDGNTPGTINEFLLRTSTGSIVISAIAFDTEPKDTTFSLQFDYTHTFVNV